MCLGTAAADGQPQPGPTAPPCGISVSGPGSFPISSPFPSGSRQISFVSRTPGLALLTLDPEVLWRGEQNGSGACMPLASLAWLPGLCSVHCFPGPEIAPRSPRVRAGGWELRFLDSTEASSPQPSADPWTTVRTPGVYS